MKDKCEIFVWMVKMHGTLEWKKNYFSQMIIEILVYGLEFFECIRLQAEEVRRGQVFLA